MRSLLITYLSLGILFVAISVPLIRRSVPPNRWYGFRLRRTLEDPEVWYAVNAHLGRRLSWVGILLMAASLACYLAPGMTVDAYARVILVVLAVSLTVAILWSMAYLRTFHHS